MDLNQVPSDQMVNGVKFEEIKVGNLCEVVLNSELEDSKIKSFEVEQRCGEVDEKSLALELEIRNKVMDLEAINGKIRVLGGEKLRIEEKIEGLKKKKASFQVGGERMCGEFCWEVKSGEEVSRVGELMLENKVLECKKNATIKEEVEIWKRRCKELEECVVELERRLKSQGKDGISIGIERTNCMNDENVCGSASQLPGAIDGVMPLEDVIMDEEENNDGRGFVPFKTPNSKKKRDLMVVMSDDEIEDCKCKPSRRVFKVNNSDSEGEYGDNNNDTTPIRHVLNRETIASESDDDDNIPISQLKKKRGRGSSQPTKILNPIRPRRRQLKYGKDEHEDGTQEMKNQTDTLMALENVANDNSSDDESENNVRSLSSFIVNDSDVEDLEDDVSNDLEDDVSKDLEDNSGELEETSDSDLDFREMMLKLGSRRERNSVWTGEGDMLADFGKSSELCMRAICALYRQQTNEEKTFKASLIHNRRGFSRLDAARGTELGEFLTDGDPNGDLVKSVEELQDHDSKGHEDCHKFAKHYSKQLFKIYKSGEDPFFL